MSAFFPRKSFGNLSGLFCFVSLLLLPGQKIDQIRVLRINVQKCDPNLAVPWIVKRFHAYHLTHTMKRPKGEMDLDLKTEKIVLGHSLIRDETNAVLREIADERVAPIVVGEFDRLALPLDRQFL